ncbi:PHO85 cyclin-1 [Pseudogymnoascus australis]
MICHLAQEVSSVAERSPYHRNPIGSSDRVQNLLTADQHLDDKIPALDYYVSSIVRQANIQVPILLTTLLYLSRLNSKLPLIGNGVRYSPHRIFLACLIISEKFLDDSSLHNRDWALCSQFEKFTFSNQEVNIIEKQVLFLLEWNLNFQVSELEHHLKPFLVRIRDSTAMLRSLSYGDRKHIHSNVYPYGARSALYGEKFKNAFISPISLSKLCFVATPRHYDYTYQKMTFA